MPNDHTSTLGTMAAGKLLVQATGGRLGPILFLLAGIVVLRRVVAAKRARRLGLRHEANG